MSTVPGTLSVLLLAVVIGGVTLVLRSGQGLRAPGPRLSADLPAALLMRAGFPVTTRNVVAVGEWLAVRFLAEGEGAAGALDADLAARLRIAVGVEPQGRAQRILDAIAEVDPAAAVRLVSRAPAELLATAGTGDGLLGGSVFEPLPVPGSFPVAPVIPVPRTSARVSVGCPAGVPGLPDAVAPVA